MSSIKKETASYFIGTSLLAVLNFVVSILYGDMFSPDDYGNYSLTFATYSLLSQIAVGWVSSSLIRYYVAHKKENREHKLIGSIFIQHVFFSIFEVISVIAMMNVLPLSPETKALAIVFSIFFFFESYVLFINTIMRVTNNSKQYNINTNLNSILKIGTLLVLYYLVGVRTTLAIALSLLIAEIVQTVYLTAKFKFFKYFSPKNYDRMVLGQLLRYGVPLIGVSVTNWVLNVSDRYVIRYFFSDYEVGLYSYSYNIASSVVTLLSQFIMLGAYPNVIRAWEEKGKTAAVDMIKQYLNIYMLLIVPICFGFLCAGKQFFETFANERYWGGYINFIITGFGIAVLGLTAYTNKVWELKKKTMATLLLSIVAALVNIGLNVWLIPLVGYTAGSITTVIAYLVYLIMSIVFSRKYMNLQIDWPKTGKIIMAAVMMALMVTVLNLVPILNNAGGFLLKITMGVVVYVMIVAMTKVVDFTTIRRLFNKKV